MRDQAKIFEVTFYKSKGRIKLYNKIGSRKDLIANGDIIYIGESEEIFRKLLCTGQGKGSFTRNGEVISIREDGSGVEAPGAPVASPQAEGELGEGPIGSDFDEDMNKCLESEPGCAINEAAGDSEVGSGSDEPAKKRPRASDEGSEPTPGPTPGSSRQ